MTWTEVPVDTGPAAGAVLLSGIPGSGKSTVAAALAARFAASAHIEVDALQGLIVNGGRWPSPERDEEADRQIFLRARNACLLADSFVAAGFLPVIDDVVVRRAHLDFYRRRIAVGPLHCVVLAPGAAKAGSATSPATRRSRRTGRSWTRRCAPNWPARRSGSTTAS